MAKNTLFFLFALSILAALLIGVSIGRRVEKTNITVKNTPNIPSPSPSPSPTATPTPIVFPTLESSPSAKSKGTSTYSDADCGYTFSYPGSYLRSNTTNQQSVIFTDQDNPKAYIAIACAQLLPRPPVTSDKIEAITIGSMAATLYHDKNPDGSPRDEVIVKHPKTGVEIIIAGYGSTFQNVLFSFRFIQ